ncbi:hypothetical protein LB941_02760 [Ligilactobacillus sp. WILCCON 0076]|uniref:Uncharacterized protein n=1 Tax=Ligilactobacillus ubinensis TaxID=2876789 RepID=A0A9X2JKL6_9LACO|nr:hypothetical protein [Ligilactobacillus ubinensis]MCP0886258.1 hypothetical protein [Ligilactobacillus ubinensis]
MTDIIYIVKDTDESEELDTFEFLIENKAMLGKHNADRSLKLFHVNSTGKVYPKNKKIQAFIDDIGLKSLPIALTLKRNSLYTANELSSLFEGLDIQIPKDDNIAKD